LYIKCRRTHFMKEMRTTIERKMEKQKMENGKKKIFFLQLKS